MIQLVISCPGCNRNLIAPSAMQAKKGGDVKVTVHPTVLTTPCSNCSTVPARIGLDVLIRHVPAK